MDWERSKVVVTGGCSFIGSHLVDLLVDLGAREVHVADDLSTGRVANIQRHLDAGRVVLHVCDLLAAGAAHDVLRGADVVFHLAAIHGGRGYIDRHQASCTRNLALDNVVIHEAYRAGVGQFVYASSGCVYPVDLQGDATTAVYLREDMVGPPYNADGSYGWAKLMGEMTLKAYHDDYGLPSVSCRLFTAYGERCLESHAVIAMIARAFLRLDPFEVWGDGTQIRNWTYVGDIVRGLVLAAEQIGDGTAVNLGTEEPVRVIDAARAVCAYTEHRPAIRLRPEMPTGPLNRVASNRLARERMGWCPQVSFAAGLQRTVDWYFADRAGAQEALRERFEHLLVER